MRKHGDAASMPLAVTNVASRVTPTRATSSESRGGRYFLCQTSEVKKQQENDANNTGNPENELLKRWNETEAYTVCVSEKTTKRSRKLVVQP